jgi:hypothetical protein
MGLKRAIHQLQLRLCVLPPRGAGLRFGVRIHTDGGEVSEDTTNLIEHWVEVGMEDARGKSSFMDSIHIPGCDVGVGYYIK